MHDLETTLVAVATPAGRGGVGCIRISGPDAHRIALSLFRASRGVPPGAKSAQASDPRFEVPEVDQHRTATPRFGRFLDRDGNRLDHGYLWLLPASNSFTAETSAELWPHGSPPVLAELVHGALELGARAAEPGEFTYRALRNGRLDLTRAEAVRDLVDARTVYQARIAFRQAEGAVAEQVEPLRLDLEEWIARAEAAVEFVEEAEVDLSRSRLAAAIDESVARCEELLSGFRVGRMIRDGATLAVVGRPNAGKSSLFNRLLAQDRAIVTDVPGTTRDTLEAELHLGGIPVRLIDTAGLRQSIDPVESEGIRRAERALGEADLVLWVLDRTTEPEAGEMEALSTAIERGRGLVSSGDESEGERGSPSLGGAAASPSVKLPRSRSEIVPADLRRLAELGPGAMESERRDTKCELTRSDADADTNTNTDTDNEAKADAKGNSNERPGETLPAGAPRKARNESGDDLPSNVVVVANKADLARNPDFPRRPDWIEVSAKTGDGLKHLRAALRQRLVGSGSIEDPVLTDARHADALRRTLGALTTAQRAAASGLSEELVLEDLRLAMNELGSITGEFTSDDLYDKIFSTFCIGK